VTRESRSDSERQLVQDTQQGDPLAVQTLIRRHLPALRAFVRLRVNRFLRARESDSDVVQSVCGELLRQLDQFEYRGETQFRNWLYVAVLNKVRQKEKYYRAEKRDPAREARLQATDAGDQLLMNCYESFYTPSQLAMAREQTALVEAAFDQLPDHYREVITLAKIVGLSQEELAATMGRTVPSARNLLARALVRLSAVLEQLELGGR